MQRAWATSVKGHSSIQPPLLHLSPVCLYRTEHTAAKILPGRLRKGYSLAKWWSQAPLPVQKEPLPKGTSHAMGKPHAWNMSPFWLSTFSALKSDSKNNLLLRELLSALMHRTDALIGAKDDDYSRGANFEHTHRLQKRCPFHYKAITLQGCFLPFSSPCSQQQWYMSFYTSNCICSRSTVSASLHPSSEQHWQTGVDELGGSNGLGATVLYFGQNGGKLSWELPPPAARTFSHASCCRKV